MARDPDPDRSEPPIAAGDARPPEAPPQRRISLPFEIFLVNQRLGGYLDRALAGTGIRPAEYAVYSLMLEAGPRTPSELASMLGMPLSTLSTYLGILLERGHAHRIPNPTDGRSVRVVLTDQGRGVVRMVNPPFGRALDALEANLDRPVPEVREVVLSILDAIDRAEAALAGEPAELERTSVPASTDGPVTDTSSS